jgi:sugar O-acyltransferase (sialic acid O-acetyltransferase NeuD family)
MKQIVIIGASGHGKVVADIAKKNGYENIVFFDDNAAIQKCGDYPVVGQSSDYKNYDCDMVVGIGNAKVRQELQSELEQSGKKIVTLIHPNAIIADDVSIGKGTVVMAGVVINPGASIGKGCIINTCASVDHDCQLGDFVHISVGAHVAGTVRIGDRTWIGAGATVSNNVHICHSCMVGAGAVVIKNIVETGVYIGVPAKKSK